MPPKTIGLVAHTLKPGVSHLLALIRFEFLRRGVGVLVEANSATLLDDASGLTVSQLADAADLLVVLGGDGTILNVVGQLGERFKPVFGINVGSLGFLTCVNSSVYKEAVSAICAGEIVFSQRTLLSVEIQNKGKVIERAAGLNDAVISRGEISRLIRLRTKIDGEPLTDFNADGLIVATPTGSTAYSLSAGGPIVAPNAGVIVVTPICPHVLTNRSIVVDQSSTIEVESIGPGDVAYVTIDGGKPLQIGPGYAVVLRVGRSRLELAALPQTSFWDVVRQKLRWSGSNF